VVVRHSGTQDLPEEELVPLITRDALAGVGTVAP
jgi:hypothetical protein